MSGSIGESPVVQWDIIDIILVQNIAHDAFRALVNLSDSPLLVSPLSDTPFLHFIVSYIIVRLHDYTSYN